MVNEMMGFGTGLGSGFGGLLWMLGSLLVVVGIVVLVAWLVARATAPDHATRTGGENTEALDILRARFARGEITEAEYTQAASVLRSTR